MIGEVRQTNITRQERSL